MVLCKTKEKGRHLLKEILEIAREKIWANYTRDIFFQGNIVVNKRGNNVIIIITNNLSNNRETSFSGIVIDKEFTAVVSHNYDKAAFRQFQGKIILKSS